MKLHYSGLIIFMAILLNGCGAEKKVEMKLFNRVSRSFDTVNYGANRGVAVDDDYIYTITNVATDGTYPHNNVLCYKHDGTYVDTHSDIYSDAWQFSSGNVIDGKLYIAVRGSELEVPPTRGNNKVVVISLSDFSVLEDHTIWSMVDGDPRWDAEGVDKHDGYFWVIYGGYSDRSTSKIDKYDKDWNHIAQYILSIPGGAAWRYQDIVWVGDYIYVNIHWDPDGPRTGVDIYKWTGSGSGFKFEKSISEPLDCHQGLAYYDNKFYFAARKNCKVRIFNAK